MDEVYREDEKERSLYERGQGEGRGRSVNVTQYIRQVDDLTRNTNIPRVRPCWDDIKRGGAEKQAKASYS